MAWTNLDKSTSTFIPQEKVGRAFYLLQEMADYLLQENGYKIVLQESMEWSNGTKHTSTFTNQTKH